MNKWIDISQSLTGDIAVWPGDPTFSFNLSNTIEENGTANVGHLSASVHTGTHIDAPFHFDNNGQQVHELDPNLFIGKAKVVDVSTYTMIGRTELEEFDLRETKRLLLKTNTRKSSTTFPDNYAVLKEDIGPFLKENGIHLIGVDTPSVDPVTSTNLKAHVSLHNNGVHILENIVLSHVEPGDYELIALPLALFGADGSPTRAVLRKV